MSFQVINPSFFSTIQDKGRFGYAHLGVTSSGVMDEYAYLILNMLLKNPKDTNVIEISFSNFELKAFKNTHIAITGAKCEFFINDIEKSIWQSHKIKVGDKIKIGKIQEGSKVYLGVKNGFKIPKEFGSNSTTIKENLGGINANKLSKGDILEFEEFSYNYNIRLKEKYVPKYEEVIELRVLLSYQKDFFPKNEIDKFFSSDFTVTNDFNRMACKLTGEKIKSQIDGIVSEGIGFGSIQIPNDGQPIILLKEKQTIGGYPKIGVVLPIDCFKLAQAKPNTKVNFKQIEYKEALKKMQEFYSSFL